jgi:restriction system protein
MLPLLKLASGANEVSSRQAAQVIADQLVLTPEERSQVIPEKQEGLYSNRFHWAKTYMTEAGLLKPLKRDCFQITERGRELLNTSPKRIDESVLMQFQEFKDFMLGEEVRAWKEVAAFFDIDIATPCDIPLPDGTRIVATAHIKDFGGPKGMIADPKWSVLEPYANALVKYGYGVSTVSIVDTHYGFDPSSTARMLADWAWSGSGPAPDWLPEISEQDSD